MAKNSFQGKRAGYVKSKHNKCFMIIREAKDLKKIYIEKLY